MKCNGCDKNIHSGHGIEVYAKTHIQGIGEVKIKLKTDWNKPITIVLCSDCYLKAFEPVRKINNLVE